MTAQSRDTTAQGTAAQDTTTAKEAGAALAADATARSNLYRLLARVFYTEPDEALLTALTQPPLRDALEEAKIDIGAILPPLPSAEQMDALGEEFTRLFLGPGKHISAHESVQLKRGSGLLWGEETTVVKNFIEEAGFEYDESYHGLPDHISVELEFLGCLAAREAEAIEAGDADTCRAAIEWQHTFISAHIGKWVANFAKRVADEAEIPFYSAFAHLVPRFLATEKAHLGKSLTREEDQ